MSEFNIKARNGQVIAVPDFAKIEVDGLKIIGDQTPDWNEPIQQNFTVLDSKIMETESSIEELSASKADKADSLAGYGIKDGMTAAEVRAIIASLKFDDIGA